MPAVDLVRDAVRATGMLAGRERLLALISGGRDSTCLLDVAVALRAGEGVAALHVHYGLRPEAVGEEAHCVELCEQLGVELEVLDASAEALRRESGNLQAWARDVRYAAAAQRAGQDGALVLVAHTSDDQVETILYRLAASPGRRALLGMPARDGRLRRPLLGCTREQTTAYCLARGLEWRDDLSNDDERFARARVRNALLPAFAAVHPAAGANVLRTAELLRAETDLLDELVADELGGAREIALERLGALPEALARLVVVRLAEQATGGYVPQAGDRVADLLALGRRGGRAELHLGGRAGAVISDGVLSMRRLPPRGAD